MRYIDTDSTAPKKSTHYKPIVPAPSHSRDRSYNQAQATTSAPLSSTSTSIATVSSFIFSSPLTPDPSPTMTPEDPKQHYTPSASQKPSISSLTETTPLPSSSRKHSLGGGQQQLPTFGDISKSASGANPSSSTSSTSSPSINPSSSNFGSSRSTHASSTVPSTGAIYSNVVGTPPMSPGHALLSPLTRPHCGITDPSQYSSSLSSSASLSSSGGGFYQLPPPVQPFSHPARPSPHQSPAMHPQSSNSHHHPLPPLPPLPNSATSASTTTGYSPRSTPQMSPIANHYLVSPALGPLSPYPTPQHQPRQYYSSPHHDPTIVSSSSSSKQSNIPAMILPASALSSGGLPLPHEISSSSSSRTFANILPQGANSRSSNNSNADVNMSSPTQGPVDRSAPSSPRRLVMLPPQSPAIGPTSGSGRPLRSQGRKSSASSTSSASTTAAAIAANTTPSSSSSRRRPSSNSRTIDQETRDLMRKVSHSAIERRRRERINDKILQLKHLVPACVDEDHLHKLSILQSTIEYIQHLKSVLPASIVNVKVGKATNNNPNNKTTDMLDALGAGIANKAPLTPLMTTTLGHIYPKRLKLDKHHYHSSQQQNEQNEHSSRYESYDDRSGGGVSGTHSSSSDEDAKDGLLLLANHSHSQSTSSSSSSSSSSVESRSRSESKRGHRKRDNTQRSTESS
ncbi:hypothetical protein FBU30_010406 [Linnemannia zychae]|nr:hypothetical protein FBU30_010406 [Linnemannia zychae]